MQRVPDAPDGAVCCHRCGAHLHQLGRYDITRALALAVTALILFVVANAYPMVALEVQGSRITTTLLHAVHELLREDVQLVAALVFVRSQQSTAEAGCFFLGPATPATLQQQRAY